jgi:hypothetical protein
MPRPLGGETRLQARIHGVRGADVVTKSCRAPPGGPHLRCRAWMWISRPIVDALAIQATSQGAAFGGFSWGSCLLFQKLVGRVQEGEMRRAAPGFSPPLARAAPQRAEPAFLGVQCVSSEVAPSGPKWPLRAPKGPLGAPWAPKGPLWASKGQLWAPKGPLQVPKGPLRAPKGLF